MQTLFIGFADDTVDPVMKGLAIRIAYLFSAQLRLSGNISNYFTMEEGLRKASIEQKIKYIDDHEKDNPNYKIAYEGYKEFKKVYKKDRGKNKELIVLMRQMEMSINGIYNSLMDRLSKIAKAAGLFDLGPITEAPSYGEYHVPYIDPESGKDGHSKLSDVLQLKLDEDDNENSTIFLLSHLFFSDEFNPGEDVLPELNAFSEKGFLQELLILPHYNYFSIADLNTIRFEANKSIEDLNQCVDTFTALMTDPAEAFKYLHNNVVTAAKTVAEDINSTGIVTNYISLVPHAAAVSKLYLGLIPHSLVLKYFEFIKASQEETITILDQMPDEEKHQLVPVLVIKRLVGEEITNITDASALPLKKSLSID